MVILLINALKVFFITWKNLNDFQVKIRIISKRRKQNEGMVSKIKGGSLKGLRV